MDNLMSTNELVKKLKTDYKTLNYDVLKVDFNWDEFRKLIIETNLFQFKPSNDGELAEVQERQEQHIDRSHTSADFDLHTDGAYYEQIPHFVILYCVNPGKAKASTYLSDTTLALDKLSSETIDMLDRLDYTYISKNAKHYVRKLIEKHPYDQRSLITNLTSRGFVSPTVRNGDVKGLPELFDYIDAFQKMCSSIQDSVVYEHNWEKNDFFIFDNNKYLHGRRNADNEIDCERHLYRIWFDGRISK